MKKLTLGILLFFSLLLLSTGHAIAQGNSGVEFVSTYSYVEEENQLLAIGGYFVNVSTDTVEGIDGIYLEVFDENDMMVAADYFYDEDLSSIVLEPGEIIEWEFHFDDLEIDPNLFYYVYHYEITYIYSEAVIEEGIKLYFNGEKLNLDVPARIENGRTLVPVRGVIEQLGFSLSYNSKTKTVSVNNGEIVLTVGSNTALVNGQEVILDVPPTIIDNRTLVPLRFIAENVNCNVHWGQKAKVISIVNLW